MSLQRSDFAEFFAELHGGSCPFAWQERLLDAVLADGWPDTIDAPTGAGKTAVIDVHVFALAFAALNGLPFPPRRLALVVGRRVLVDDQLAHARAIAAALRAPTFGVLRRVAQGLGSLAGTQDDPLVVARLRGGEPPSRRWVDDPAAAAVLCATPEMWGSRLLFRGYGSPARAWPREAGLLAVDTVAVVDEAHLAQQLLRTARRVGELVPVAEREWTGPRPVQVVETTATPASGGGGRVGVDEADLAVDQVLADRLQRPKPVTLVPRKDWATVRPRHTVVDEFVRRVADLRQQVGTGTLGCFVNTVARAVALAAALREEGLTVVLLCGQVRPIDVERLRLEYPNLLTTAGDARVDVIVSTQTLEVGVDLDLTGIVSELAAGSALAQRAGRVNRRGLRPAGPVVVIVPDGPIRADARSGPYEGDELSKALDWLRGRAADPMGLAPWAVRADPPPRATSRRTLYQRPELAQACHWSRTADDLAADPDLDLWLTEDLSPDHSVGFVVRRELGGTDEPTMPLNDVIALVKRLPPRRHEVFGVPIRSARDVLTQAFEVLRKKDPGIEFPGVVVRGGDDIAPLTWRTDDQRLRPILRPGDTVVLGASLKLFTAPGKAGDLTTPQVAVHADDETHRHTADDVLEEYGRLAEPEREPRRPLRHGEIVLRLPVTNALRRSLTTDEGEPETDSIHVRMAVADALRVRTDAMSRAAAELLADPNPRKVDFEVLRDEDGEPILVLVIDGRRAVADDVARQEWSPKTGRVLLDDHQEAVAERAAELAGRLGLPDELAEALRLAGRHHDEGKRDGRFQIRLGARGEVPLAKSSGLAGPMTVRRRIDKSGLPSGWRHEQLSVVHAWAEVPDDVDRELVARLIGTSHGFGRVWFPHNAGDLVGPDVDSATKELAETLFDEGEWDELIERTERRYGVWICAFLEAVLRAADGQVSGEGR